MIILWDYRNEWSVELTGKWFVDKDSTILYFEVVQLANVPVPAEYWTTENAIVVYEGYNCGG